jgi:hypothetical protein
MAPSVAISNNRFIAPLNGDLTITGFAPSAILGIVVRPDVGAVVLDGFAPDVAVTHNVAAVPGVGSLVVNGFAPSINAPVAVPIGAGELTVTGYAPTINGAVAGPRPTTVTLDQPIATVALSHVATVSLETFARGVTIDQPIATATLAHTATVTLTAVSATVELGDAVGGPPDGGGGGGTEGEAVTGTGALSVTGFAPSVVATGPQTATPGVGALIVTGFAPNAVATGPQSVAPGVGSLVVVGMRPHIPGASGEPSDADLADPSYILDTMFPEVTAQILADGGTPNVVASQSFRHAQTTSVDDVGVVWTGVPVPEGYDPGPESSVAIDLDSDDPLSPPTAYRKHQKLAWTPGGVGHDSLMMEPIVSGSLPNFWLCFTLRIRKPFIAPASNGQKIFDWFESNPTDPSHPGFGWFQYGWSGGPLGAANDLPVLADDRLGVFFTPEGPPELGGSYNVQTGEGGTLMHVATDEWVRLAVGLKASSAYGVEDGRLMAYVNGVKNIDRAFKSTAGDFIRFDWQCMFGGDIGSLQQHYDYLNTVSGFEDVVAADNVYECGHIAIIRAV